jgi:hypothetical protein
MANVQHSTLTDPNLHEPKGASSASANQLYLSDGSGSGTWTNATRFPGTGWGKYSNTTYVSTTALAISTTSVLLPFTTDDVVSNLPISLTGTTTALMNLSTEALLFVSNADLHSITVTFEIYSVSGSPAHMDIKLFGSSDGSTYATKLYENTVSLIKGAGQVITESFLVNVTSDMVSHGAKIYLTTNSGTANIINIGLISARVHKAR